MMRLLCLLLTYAMASATTDTIPSEGTLSYVPSQEPTLEPTATFSTEPTYEPTFSEQPTKEPTMVETEPPSVVETVPPSAVPSLEPTTSSPPSLEPSAYPTYEPTVTASPTNVVSSEPTGMPSDAPSGMPTEVPPTLLATVELDFGDNLADSSAVQDAIQGVLDGILAVMPEGADVTVTVVMTTTERTALFIAGGTLPEDIKEDILEAVTSVRCTGLPTCTVTEVMNRRRQLQTSTQLDIDAESTINQDTDISGSTDFDDPDFVDEVNNAATTGTLDAATVQTRSVTATAEVNVPSGTPASVADAVEDAAQDTEAIQTSVETETGTMIDEVAVTLAPSGNSEDGDDGLSGGAIAGIVIGVTVFVGAVVVGGFLWYQGGERRPDTNVRVTETEQAMADA